mmetsp:Transcript_15239/g.21415  ORF Transcript_15239/g.21415 Transcript_15239/m.21415 type:complete len:337 (-) Transcript_15239:349-1359(-)
MSSFVLPDLSSMLSSPTAIVGTVLMLLVAFEAHYLLHLALKRRKARRQLRASSKSISVVLPSATDAGSKGDIETPTVAHPLPPLPLPKSSKKNKSIPSLPAKMHRDPPSNIKFLENVNLSKGSLSMVPMERMSSAEQRLGTAIEAAMEAMNRIQSTDDACAVKPLEVIDRLRSRGKPHKGVAQFGCATVTGTKVTLIEDVQDVFRSNAPLMPSKADDEQTKSLIGTAKKVDRRCAECTRPLKEGNLSLFCSRCDSNDTAQETSPNTRENAEASNVKEIVWETVRTRRRKKSEKRSSGNKKSSRKPNKKKANGASSPSMRKSRGRPARRPRSVSTRG